MATKNAATVVKAAEGLDARRNAWLSSGLGLDEIAILLAAEAKKARKEAKHATVTRHMPRDRFQKHAKAIPVVVNGEHYEAQVRANNPDKSYGWTISEKMVVEVDGEMVECQLGFNLTVIGSKPIK